MKIEDYMRADIGINKNSIHLYGSIEYAQESIQISPPISSGPVTIQGVINTMLQLLFGVGIVLTIVFLVMSGIRFIVAGNDAKKVEGARRSFTSAIIGLTIIILTFAIIRLVASLLGADPDSLFTLIPDRIQL